MKVDHTLYDREPGRVPATKEERIGQTLKGPLGFVVRGFSLQWFTICLDTGVLSIALHQLPYQFRGSGVLSTVLFVLNLTVCAIFTTVFLVRLSLYRWAFLQEIFDDIEEISFLGAPAIAFLTLTAQVGLTLSTSWGYRWTILTYVLWWIGMTWTVLICTTLYICSIKLSIVDNKTLPTAIFLPPVAVMTAATVGGLMVNNADGMSATLAVPVIIVSYLCVGYAALLSVIVYAIYMHKLMGLGWPAPEKIPGMILLIGPMGQSSTALLLLGTAANTKEFFAKYDRGTFLKGPQALALDAAGTLFALLLLGLGFFWICVAVFSIIEAAVRRRLTLGMSWWSTIFPLCTIVTAVSTLSVKMDSDACRIIATGLYLILLIIYLGNCFFTLPVTAYRSFRKDRCRQRID